MITQVIITLLKILFLAWSATVLLLLLFPLQAFPALIVIICLLGYGMLLSLPVRLLPYLYSLPLVLVMLVLTYHQNMIY